MVSMNVLMIFLVAGWAGPVSREISDCTVMILALQGTYEGGCRKGLAQGQGTAKGADTYTGNFRNGFPNGQGTYTWSTGDVYKGEWRMGKRDGTGILTATLNGRDTTLSGIWKDDRYMGPEPENPKILYQNNVVSTSFRRTGEDKKVCISFYQNGTYNTVEALDIAASSGTEKRVSNTVTLWNVEFPFHCKITYSSWNSLKTFLYHCTLEFEIARPGFWDLRITN